MVILVVVACRVEQGEDINPSISYSRIYYHIEVASQRALAG